MTDSKQPKKSILPEDLLAAAMGETQRQEVLEQCSLAEREEIAELESFMRQCRELEAQALELQPVPSDLASNQEQDSRSSDLVAKILAQTTREDLSFRGDLRLLRSFVRGRLQDSPLLRAAAALLLLQLLFTPAVLAYLALRPSNPEPTMYLRIEQPQDAGLRDAAEESLEAFLPARDLDGALDELSRDLRQDEVLALGRDLPQPLESGAGEERLENQVVAQRLDSQSRRGDLLNLATAGWEDPLVRALSVEAALDVLSRGSLGPDPEGILISLLKDLPEAGEPLDQRLLGAALARVDAHGLLTEAGQVRLAEMRRTSSRDPLLAAGPRDGGPLASEWKQALARSLTRRGIAEGSARHLCGSD